uniref:Uncharacterized protein n=1 Tax=viral metagenome TaxID=1070528 RepID=A0A6H1Z5W3_9ZZZZ
MKSIETYIEEVKKKLKLATYAQTMQHLGMPRQAWTKIQKGQGVSAKNAIRIASALNIDPAEVLAVSMALQAENNETRNLWLRIAKDYETDHEEAI